MLESQELEAGAHLESTHSRGEQEIPAAAHSLFSIYTHQDAVPVNSATHNGNWTLALAVGHLSTLITVIMTLPRLCAWRLVSWVILDPLRLTSDTNLNMLKPCFPWGGGGRNQEFKIFLDYVVGSELSYAI